MILALESAIAGGSLSIIENGRILAGWNGSSDVSRAEDLLPAIESVIINTGIERKDLSMIAVSGGPGSFTGIRIGMSTALGLAAGLKIPITCVSLLRAMAASANEGPVLAAVPMGRASICIQTFLKDSDAICDEGVPITLTEPDFAERVEHWKGSVATHHSLASLCHNVDIIDLGLDLASVVGKYCEQHPNESERPLFISKSF